MKRRMTYLGALALIAGFTLVASIGRTAEAVKQPQIMKEPAAKDSSAKTSVLQGRKLQIPRSDLVVTSIGTRGAARVSMIGTPPMETIEAPVRVVVRNQGNAPAAVFKASAHYREPSGREFAVAFSVTGASTLWYPMTSAPLAAGASVTFDGSLLFQPATHGMTVKAWAVADSCAGDEFMPAHCRVAESKEDNNRSPVITVALP